ncbi:vacuolar-type H+-translocating inorganic pyrophosphatase, putative [Plasmodium knowlesi strain H]|uniref:H(+)-exporting diphosphatase n=2 Tax=Plasmodium knowlesi TaxID=5850 RepID=A0A679L802_PLAKH|nr:vacuolar-type H+-translocating inorganic pyrophosphatase, putative [Plasmodium knowlesi strain H]OTN63925.1 putative Vacuolar-type H+-translocating inorganic pyrophosphatase [Plasmodium knowlesi]CAA9991145.1 vacuolar-type H+-translocating inorganic pyrophosphatase, putative [Plasmodium knowlesi strain H]VVS80619.1 vacuolar-type H+-translocating inorganic pyrophosphatase, putative [Plasmodium knowlesi strain H]
MLPFHGNGKRKRFPNVMSFFGGVYSKGSFQSRKVGDVPKTQKGENLPYMRNAQGWSLPMGEVQYEQCGDYEDDVTSFGCLKWYINRSRKQRILINAGVLLAFATATYGTYQTVDNVKTVCLVGLSLYSAFFLLFALHMLSSVLKDEYDSYSSVPGSDGWMGNGRKDGVTTYQIRVTPEQIGLPHRNSQTMEPNNGDKRGEGRTEVVHETGDQTLGAPNDGYEVLSLEDIAKPIKEGSEGFFAVQYNSIFKISVAFTILLMFLYMLRGDNTKFPREKNTMMEGITEEYIEISPFAYSIITSISFLLGATCSSIAAYNGIYVAVRANVRVAKASTYSYRKALMTCFRSGAISAIVNVALAIFGICSLLVLINILYPSLSFTKYPLLIVGYGFGASLVAMLYQLAGGIYTKAADIGADLVGKVEKHIPEDDARNPAVIADLVGDNVGDCAGQCADLFESISAEIIASMILGGTLCENGIISEKRANYFVLFPLFVHSMDLLVSTIGVYLVRTRSDYASNPVGRKARVNSKQHVGEDKYIHLSSASYNAAMENGANVNIHSANGDTALSSISRDHYNDNELEMIGEHLENPLKVMLRAYIVTCLLAMGFFFFFCKMLFVMGENRPNDYSWVYLSLCGLVGMVCSYLFVILTRYYTDYSYPKVRKIAHASLSGPATNIITGLYVGMESTFLPTIVISVSLLASYYLGLASNLTGDGRAINGLYGTSVATMGMLSTAVFILSMSNFGPIADNAGGIVEMSNQPESVRFITDKLDAVGNVTKANTKGYSVGSAALACFLLFSAFLSEVSLHAKTPFTTVDIALPEVFIGGILGSVVVFLFASWSLDAVGNTAEEVLKEVRRQFNEHPGILTYDEKPDYHTCVSIISRKALIETIKPGLLALCAPIIIGLLFKQIGKFRNNDLLGAQVIASFIMFSTSTGILMALFLNNAGGAWDNAKKYIESGFYGGKNSPAHVSSVIGDTVGDPCKDTAGPSIHVLIKLISTITMVMTPLIASSSEL